MIHVSPEAVKKIKELQTEAPMGPGMGLRVAVVGGGCSGMSYKLDFAKEPTPEDKVFEQDGVRVFVDPKSYLYIKGLTLEYSGGLNGTGFGFKNPNATKSCGCGSSFAV
ncbi:MAG: iron-sulfur cluster assembly accessory protein [Bdellovibrionales bacterium]|nr:iron-sulfur cluster assembly accessory protein [Bdellovibrionales bacterium]